jgi:L-ascorbate metabolism protein UlaG (beta-lactamase superfamily)
MGGKVAALAMTRFVKPEIAIPCHYGSFPLVDANADRFLAGLAGSTIKALVPKKGEAVTL